MVDYKTLKEEAEKLGWILCDWKRFKKHDIIILVHAEDGIILKMTLKNHLENIPLRTFQNFLGRKNPQKTLDEVKPSSIEN